MIEAYPFAYTISVANTWEYKTVTIPGDTSGTWDTDNTAGMTITFGMGTGSTYTQAQQMLGKQEINFSLPPQLLHSRYNRCYIGHVTGVQLEAGTTATAF
jgi:hypothetical protein